MASGGPRSKFPSPVPNLFVSRATMTSSRDHDTPQDDVAPDTQPSPGSVAVDSGEGSPYETGEDRAHDAFDDPWYDDHDVYDEHDRYDEHDEYDEYDEHYGYDEATGRGGRVVSFCRRHKILTGVAIVALPFLLLVTFSWGKAMTKEGSESFMAKNVQWFRDNNLGFIVDRIEQKYYESNQPESGGTPDAIATGPGAAVTTPGAPSTVAGAGQKATTTAPLPKHIDPPAPLKSPAAVPIENEGKWFGAGPDMGGGLYPMYYTKVRPNAEKSSLIIFVAWIDPNLAKIELHPGTELPGGKWMTPTRIPEANAASAIAGLNSGFRMDQARGGYYAEGRQQQPLRNGSASLVFYNDGRMDVAQWGRDVGPDQLPNIKAVRQNLELLVDNGAPVPDIDRKDWGALLPNSYFIWRTAFGITKDGALIYVGGPALQPRDLAQRLIDAGAVRAMEMDINPEWMTANLFTKGLDGKIHGVKGLEGPQDKGGQRQPADRYLSTDTRDFVVIYSK